MALEQRGGPGPHGRAGRRNANGNMLIPWPGADVFGATAGRPIEEQQQGWLAGRRRGDKALCRELESLLTDVSEAP